MTSDQLLLWFNFNVRLYDVGERQAAPLSVRLLDHGDRRPAFTVETDQLAMKVPLPVDRFRDSDARRQPRETFVVGLFVQPPVKPRRGHFEHVLMRDDVFDVENQSDALAHRRAIVERHAARLIYVYA